MHIEFGLQISHLCNPCHALIWAYQYCLNVSPATVLWCAQAQQLHMAMPLATDRLQLVS